MFLTGDKANRNSGVDVWHFIARRPWEKIECGGVPSELPVVQDTNHTAASACLLLKGRRRDLTPSPQLPVD